MKWMGKRELKAVLGVLAACLLLLKGAVPVLAADAGYDGGRTVAIEIQMGQDDRHREEAKFYIYQIAVVLPVAPVSGNISVELTKVYAPTGVSLVAENTSQLLKQIRTLRTYIKEHGISPDYTVTTDAKGYGVVEDLEQGVYLVVPDNSNPNYGVIATSMIVLPRRDDDGSWIYTELMRPKYTDEPDEYFEEGEEDDTMLGREETTVAPETESASDEETLPVESASETQEMTSPAADTTTVTAPSTTVPPTQGTTSVVRTSSSEQQILGIDDPAGMMGMVLIAVGAFLLIAAGGLLLGRRIGSHK